jgi:hypothetical protein
MARRLLLGIPLLQLVALLQLLLAPVQVVTSPAILNVTAFEAAVAAVTHVKLEVSWQVTKLPSIGLVGVKVLEVAPDTAMLFTNHWYVGVAPPLLIEEVKEIPDEQMLALFCEIVIVGVTCGVTVIVIGVLVTTAGEAQVALEVSTHLITSPLTKSVPATPV